MRSTRVVVDLGFGDAGKGTLVDALARRCSSPPLVVRHNGGAQAGHNVHTSDGRHHTFSQLGAATFVPGARTLLSKYMVFHPGALMVEVSHLRSIGVDDVLSRLAIDERALVITPYQQAANRIRENARGYARHGTCGVGVGETVADALELGDDAVRVADLRDPTALRRKLSRIREHKLSQVKPLFGTTSEECYASRDVLVFSYVLDRTVETFITLGRRLRILDPKESTSEIREAEHVIFEGAQGVLLDEWHGFHPHTTWSTTTTKNAEALIAEAEREEDTWWIGVLRAYATRHGQGPFPTESSVLSSRLADDHNTAGGWQGRFRVGWFDAPLARYALDLCPKITDLAITCLDRLAEIPEYEWESYGWEICDSYDVRPAARERFVMEDGWAKKPLVKPPGDLAYQEQLTADLTGCKPVMYSAPRDIPSYVKMIEERVGRPVTILSTGKTAEEKSILPRALKRLGSAASMERISAVIRLRPVMKGTVVPGPEDTIRIAQALLARAEASSKQKPVSVSVLKNLGTVVVAGSPEYLRALVDDDSVAEATYNEAGAVEAIVPVRVGPVVPNEEVPLTRRR